MKVPADRKVVDAMFVLTPKHFLQYTGLHRVFPRRTYVILWVGLVVQHDEVVFPGEVGEVQYVLRCNVSGVSRICSFRDIHVRVLTPSVSQLRSSVLDISQCIHWNISL